jgi:nucleoside-diphosphate-sugar epimerase
VTQNIFVTGGTGVLGRPVVRALVAQGHRVRVLVHSPEGEQTTRSLGAEPVKADLLDAASVAEAIGEVEVVLHLATRIPPSGKMGKRQAWAENDRLRTEGTRNLVDAALAGHMQTLLYPSVRLVYPDSGDAWIDAGTTPPAPIAFLRSTIDAASEVRRFAEHGRRGVVLRMGSFYGPESGHTQDMLAYARRGVAAVVGPGDAYQASIWIDDAAGSASDRFLRGTRRSSARRPRAWWPRAGAGRGEPGPALEDLHGQLDGGQVIEARAVRQPERRAHRGPPPRSPQPLAVQGACRAWT